jgi:PST family polysaccharide transporter
MFDQLKQKLAGTDEKKRLMSNIFSLVVLQGANYILPLLTLPYLVRVLGVEYFGLLAFSTATIGFFIIITDYGFNLSATRQVAIHRDDKLKLNEIFSSVMMIKSFFLVLSLLLLCLLLLTVDKFGQHWQVYMITFGVVIGQVLFPVWLFQGLEQMKYITYLNIAAKSFFTVCIFVFVQSQDDYLWVPLLTSLGFVLAGAWSLYLVKAKFDIGFQWQSLETIRFQLTEGWHVFFSSLSISMYTIAVPFILGLFANNAAVGYFSAADKLVQAVKGLFQPVSQAMYPLISQKMTEDKQAGLTFVRKMTWLVGGAMFIMSGLLFVLAEPIVVLVLGAGYQASVVLLKIMAFLPFVIVLSNMLGIQTMLTLGYQKAFSHILLAAALLGIAMGAASSWLFHAEGAAWSLLIVEILVTLMMWVFVKRVVYRVQ